MKVCMECGNEIGLKRLKAKPSALLCISCQEKNDVEVAREAAVDLYRIACRLEPRGVEASVKLASGGLADVMDRSTKGLSRDGAVQWVMSQRGIESWAAHGGSRVRAS